MAPLSYNCICGQRATCSNIFRLYRALVGLFDHELIHPVFEIILKDFIGWLKLIHTSINIPCCSPWKLSDLRQLNICELITHVCHQWLQAYDATVLYYQAQTVFCSQPGPIVDI